MSDFYVININGSQQKVKIGDEITVDSINADEGAKLTYSDVLLSSIGDKVVVGTPNVGELKASFEVVKHIKGDKLYIRKFRAKSRYTRKTGYRDSLTLIKLLEVK